LLVPEGLKRSAEQAPLPAGARLTEAVDRLVQLYEATGEKDKAEAWRGKREEGAKADKQKP
jgi:hypothetical protein